MFPVYTTSYVSMSDLLSIEEMEPFSDECPVSYGDASVTLIYVDSFLETVSEFAPPERVDEIRRILGEAAVSYVNLEA